MIFRRDIGIWRAALAGLVLTLSACGDPQEDLAPVDRARAALMAGDAVQAEVILKDALAAGGQREDLAAFLGEAELKQGQLAEAREWLGEGNFSEETRSHGFHMLARLEMDEGNLPAAGEAFDKALAINRENAALWVDIARLRYRGGEQVQAVEASVYAVEIDPDNPQALQYRAQLVRDSQGMLASLEWFERALAVDPENTDLLYDYAATLGELGRAHDMLAVVRDIATIDPGNRRIYYLQAVLAARAEKYELARSLLLRASKAVQEMPAAMLLSGVIDIENGNYASAAQTLERLAAEQPDNRRVRELLARALSLGGNDEELVYLFEKDARHPVSSVYLKTLVGRALEAMDQREKAAYFLDEVAKPVSGNLIVIPAGTDLDVAEARGSERGVDALQLVRARISGGSPRSATSAVEPFLSRFEGSADALSLAGDAAFADRRFKLAIKRYEKASSVRRPWIMSRKLMKAYAASGDELAATGLLADYFTGDPANVEAASELARIAIANNDWDGAATFLDHALTNGAYRDPYLLVIRAKVALELGDTATALEAADAAYAIMPMSREATEALALSYRAIGDHDDYAEVLEKKMKKLPPG